MRTKNAARITAAESEHMAKVKSLSCPVCDAPGPSEAHHIEQGDHWTTISLCAECHTHPFHGWHGQRRAWALRKMYDERSALSVTIRRLMTNEVPT